MLLVVLFCGCDKEAFIPESSETPATVQNKSLDPKFPNGKFPLELGTKLTNPYSVSAMISAGNQLKTQGFGTTEDVNRIKPTHTYSRFIITDEDDFERLQEIDTTINFYPYPLDYEIIKVDTTYNDTFPLEWYAAIPVNFIIPDGKISHEVVDELYLPSDETEADDGNFSDRLVKESLRLTGNLTDTQEKRSRWRPSGRITVDDPVLNQEIGIHGLRVKARRWFTTHEGITDANGDFTCNGTFKREARYSFDWERYHFNVRGKNIDVTGTTSDQPFIRKIRSNTFQQSAAFVFMAAHQYYYLDLPNINRPPLNSILKPQMRIKIFEKPGRASHLASRRVFGLGNWIKIYTETEGIISNRQQRLDFLYLTTLHELAHAAHWKIFSNDFDDVESNVIESWAVGVAEKLIQAKYPGFVRFGDFTFMAMRDADGPDLEPNYTSLFIDLEDDFNQGLTDVNKPFDRVKGYTLEQIEPFLETCETFDCIQEALEDNFDNPTESFLPELFQQHKTLSR